MYVISLTYDMEQYPNTFVSFIHCTSDSPNIFHGMKFSPIKSIRIYILQCTIGKYFWFLFFFFLCSCASYVGRLFPLSNIPTPFLTEFTFDVTLKKGKKKISSGKIHQVLFYVREFN